MKKIFNLLAILITVTISAQISFENLKNISDETTGLKSFVVDGLGFKLVQNEGDRSYTFMNNADLDHTVILEIIRQAGKKNVIMMNVGASFNLSNFKNELTLNYFTYNGIKELGTTKMHSYNNNDFVITIGTEKNVNGATQFLIIPRDK